MRNINAYAYTEIKRLEDALDFGRIGSLYAEYVQSVFRNLYTRLSEIDYTESDTLEVSDMVRLIEGKLEGLLSVLKLELKYDIELIEETIEICQDLLEYLEVYEQEL